MSVNSKLSWIGAILRVRAWLLATHNVFWAAAVRLYCQLQSGTLLTPEFSLVNDAAKLCARKERQGRYFNRGKHVLSPVQTGETIRVRSPSGTWRPAECLREVVPRSYEVLVDGAVRRRNRKDIWRTAERRNLPRKLNPLPKFKGLLLRRQVLFLKLLLLALRRHPLRLIVWMNPRHHLL